jgi:hypothetical protein
VIHCNKFFNKMRFMFCLSGAILPYDKAKAIDLSGADGLLDFDSAIGFTIPRSISVFRSADQSDHLYFIVPNSIRLVAKPDKTPEFSLFHDGGNSGKEGYMSFSLEPLIDANDVSDVINEIRISDPQAKFGVPQPLNSFFYVLGPNMPLHSLVAQLDAGNPLKTKSSFSTPVSSIAVRASLIPSSYKYAIFTIGHDFTLKGTTRDEQGNIKIVERKLATSYVINGLCAIYPDLIVNISTRSIGCGRQFYPRRLIKDIQALLNRKGFSAGVADGVLGQNTEAAIRKFQRDRSLAIDGIPSVDLLERLKTM